MDIRIKTPTISIYESLYRKVYLYVCTGLPDNESSMLAPDSYSFISVSQAPFNAFPNDLLVDSGGNFYCNVIAAQTETETFAATTTTDGFAESLYRARQFTCLSNNFVLLPETVLVCTIDAPLTFDTKGNRTDKNPIYIITSSNSTIQTDDWHTISDSIYKDDTYSEFTCADMALLQERYVNCAFTFYKNDTGQITNPTNLLSKPGFSITFNQPGFLTNNNASLISVQNERPRRNDLQIDKANIGIYPWKMYARFFDNDTIQMYCDWLDTSLYLPINLISPFVAGADLKEIFNNPVVGTPADNALLLIYDILAASYLYMTNFQPPNAPSDWRTKPSTNTGSLGQIDEKFSIGTKYVRNVLQCSSQSPQVVIDGMYSDFVAQNPSADIGLKKLTKAVITSLSRYISSSYSVAGGFNDAYRSVLPWSLIPSKFGLIIDDKGVVSLDTGSLTFLFDSEFFTSDSQGNLIPKDNVYFPSQIWEVDGEQTQFLPTIPSVLTPEDPSGDAKELLASAMLSANNKALEYLWYIPLKNPADFVNIIKGQISNGQQVIKLTGISTLSSPYTSGVLTPQEAPDYLTKYLQNIYGSSSTVEVVSIGDINTTSEAPQNFGVEFNGTEDQWHAFKAGRNWPIIRQNPNDPPLNTDELKQVLKAWTYPNDNTITLDRITITSVSSAIAYDWADQNVGINVRFTYTIADYFLQNAAANVTTGSFIFKNNKLIYNKDAWTAYLRNQKVDLTSQIVLNYNEVNSNDIGNVRQLVLGLFWVSSVKIDMGEFTFTLPNLFNDNDESIVLQQIIFT